MRKRNGKIIRKVDLINWLKEEAKASDERGKNSRKQNDTTGYHFYHFGQRNAYIRVMWFLEHDKIPRKRTKKENPYG